ncbi:MAG TPA: tetratricopeptide repeat protein, partial [Rhodothermales bacterium]|nr:tetratricopeptide repeat protein [Rhodothermales bacterium]
FNDVRTLANTLLFDLHDELRDLPGATSARQKLVSRALLYLDNLNREAGNDPSLQLELAEAYSQVGQIQGNPHYTNLGDLAGARESYEKALALHEALWQHDTTNTAVQQALANSLGHLGVVTSWMGEEAETPRRRALALLTPLTTPTALNPEVLHDMGRIRSKLGWGIIFDGRYDEGLAHLDTAVVILETLAQQEPDNLALQLHLWRAYSYQADGLSFSGRQRPLLDLMTEKGLPLLERLSQKHPNHTRVLYGLHICYGYLGTAYTHLGQAEENLHTHQTSLHYAEAMVQVDSTNQKGKEAVGRALVSLGMTLAEQGRIDEAAHTQAIALARAHYDQNHETTEAGNKLALGYRFLCRILVNADRLTEALEPCEESIAIQETVVARSHPSSSATSARLMGIPPASIGHWHSKLEQKPTARPTSNRRCTGMTSACPSAGSESRHRGRRQLGSPPGLPGRRAGSADAANEPLKPLTACVKSGSRGSGQSVSDR